MAGRPRFRDGEKRTEKITVHVTPEMMKDFQRLATLTGKNPSILLLEMIEQKIEKNFDALQDIKNAESKIV